MNPSADCGNIGVIMGGCSSEKEISLKSGNAIYEALLSASFHAIPIEITTHNEDEIISSLKQAKIDIVFIALHGKFGEDGTLQEILDNHSVCYTGSGPKASRLAMNKVSTYNLVRQGHIQVPEFKVLTHKEDWDEPESQEDALKCPVIVKPAQEGSSIGISLVKAEDQLQKGIEMAFQYDDKIIIEKYISGREMTVGILNDKAFQPVEIRPSRQFFDFEAKYEKGKTEYVIPAPVDKELTEQLMEISLEAHQLIGCRDFSRVDFILDNKTPVFLEINTIPGFTQTSLLPMAAKSEGLDFPELCSEIVNLAATRKLKECV